MYSMTASVAGTPSWCEILMAVASESRRVVSAHSRHFLGLSVLFLLPLSSILVASPSLLHSSHRFTLDPHPQSLLRLPTPPGGPHPPAAAAVAVAAASLALFLCGVASIPRSVHHGFFGRPVKLVPVLRSLPRALPILLLSLLASAVLCSLLVTLVVSLLLLSLRVLHLLALSSPAATSAACLIAAAASILALLYLTTNWSLASVLSVIESTWGFEPLRRSSYLVEVTRWSAFFHNLFFGFGILLVLWCFRLSAADGGAAGREMVLVVVRTVFGSAATAMLMLYWLVATTVLYMYCKALRRELTREIAEEFAWEYVCLPFDDLKVPQVVSIVQQ